MDDRVFNLLFQKVCRVVEALEPFTIQSAEIQRMWYGPRGFFLLTPEGPGRYSELVRHALRYGTWNERFSPEYVSRRLRDIIERHVTEGQENAREALRALVAQLDAYHEEHTVYVPVYGIDIPDAPTRTIGNLTLHQSTNAFLDTITDKDSFDRSYVQRHTDAHVWAEVRVIAEPTHAVTRAEEQCTPLIDLLRFWMASMTPNNTPCAIGLQGDVVTKERPRIAINNTTGAKRFDPHRSRLLPGFSLTNDVITNIQRSPLGSLAELTTIPPEQLTRFHKLLCTGSTRSGTAESTRTQWIGS